jgi:Na+-driven multidrug efflux pump
VAYGRKWKLQLGMGSAVETRCGQAYGGLKHDMLGIYLQRATVLLMATGVPLAAVYASSRPILVLLGESPEIASAAATFVYGLIPQIVAYAAIFPIQKFLQAQSIVAPSAYISAATLAFHLALSYLIVYRLGLGLLGASLMLSVSNWVIAVGQFVYIVASRRFRLTWTGFSWQAFLRPAGVLQALRRLRRHALPRDVVLPDTRAHRRPAQGPRACVGLAICLVTFPRPGTLSYLKWSSICEAFFIWR